MYWFDGACPEEPIRLFSSAHMQTLPTHLASFTGWPDHTRRDCTDTGHGGWDRLRIMCGKRNIEIELHSAYESEMKTLIAPIQAL
jgi:hypothetical protein